MRCKGKRTNATLFSKLGKGLLAPVVFVLVCGCSSSMELIKLERDEFARLKNQPEIQAIHYPPESFKVFKKDFEGTATVIGALFGAIGGVFIGIAEFKASKSAGAEVIEKCSLQDPTIRVKENFLSTLQERPELTIIRDMEEPFKNDDMKMLRKDFGNQVILDFKTLIWTLQKKPKHNDRGYYLDLKLRARLIRLDKLKIIWQGICDITDKNTKNSPILEELTADNGALLKEKLKEAEDKCAEQLLAQFSGEKNKGKTITVY